MFAICIFVQNGVLYIEDKQNNSRKQEHNIKVCITLLSSPSLDLWCGNGVSLHSEGEDCSWLLGSDSRGLGCNASLILFEFCCVSDEFTTHWGVKVWRETWPVLWPYSCHSVCVKIIGYYIIHISLGLFTKRSPSVTYINRSVFQLFVNTWLPVVKAFFHFFHWTARRAICFWNKST